MELPLRLLCILKCGTQFFKDWGGMPAALCLLVSRLIGLPVARSSLLLSHYLGPSMA
jgi:hypothetical protein